MQKYLLIPLLFVGCVMVAEKTDAERVQDAIEKLELEKVAELLDEITLQRSDKRNLIKQARAQISNARENVSLLKSKWDLAKLIGGSATTVAGVVGAAAGGCLGWYFRSGSTYYDHRLPLFLNTYENDLDARDRLGKVLSGSRYIWRPRACWCLLCAERLLL